jgi:hypothetical protein
LKMATKATKTVNAIPKPPITDAILEGNKKAPKPKKIKIVSEKFYDFFEQIAEERFFPMAQEEVDEMIIEKLNETITPDPIIEDLLEDLMKEEKEVSDVEVSPITEGLIEDLMEEAQDEEVEEEISDEVKEFLSYEMEDLMEFIQLANERLVFLQSNEISEIEAEISRLKERLAVLKGQTDTIKDEMGFPMKEKKKKAFDPIVNPNDPSEVYTAGRLPEWVIELSKTTGKTIRQLRGIDD